MFQHILLFRFIIIIKILHILTNDSSIQVCRMENHDNETQEQY